MKITVRHSRFLGRALCVVSCGALALSLATSAVVAPQAYAAKSSTPITSIAFSLSTFYCTGGQVYPSVTLLSGTSILERGLTGSGRNVSIAGLKGHRLPGAYEVTVQGRGKYCGTATGSFSIKVMPTVLQSVVRNGHGFRASWKPLSNTYSSGYQVRYSANKSMKKSTVCTVKRSSSKSVKGLSSGKRYYVQVRSYKTVDGSARYSNWSPKKSISIV